MKFRIFSALLGVAAVATSASAVDLAEWTFETSAPALTDSTASGSFAAENGLFAGASFASGLHASALTDWSNPSGNGSFESFSSNNWGIGDYYQFTTSTLGYENITFGWDQVASGTGPMTFDVEWSSDGTTFNTLVDDYAVLGGGSFFWSSGTYDSQYTYGPNALPAGAANLATLYIRLTNQVTPGGTSGTNRVDNVIISGTAIPTPGALMLAGVAGVAATRRRR